VVVVTDANLARQAHDVLDDITKHCTGRPDLFCFARDLDAEARGALEHVPRLTIAPIPVGMPEGPLQPHIDPALAELFYTRFVCWDDRFDRYDSVIYLDVDTVVLADLDPLVGDEFLAAPDADPSSSFVDPDDPRLGARLREDEIAGDGVTANAGVFSVGRQWRNAEQRALIARLVERYGAYFRVGDQSALNVWMRYNGLTPRLPPAFNCQVVRTIGRRGGIAAVRHAHVLHFNGLTLSNQRLALRNARACLRVPGIGRDLFAVSHRMLFDEYRQRPAATRILHAAVATRDRTRAVVGAR
jgi:lipopolysaccharide biosynthesis glycosyltransferase